MKILSNSKSGVVEISCTLAEMALLDKEMYAPTSVCLVCDGAGLAVYMLSYDKSAWVQIG